MAKHAPPAPSLTEAQVMLQERAASELALLNDERKAERRLRKRMVTLAREERRLAEAVERHSSRLALVTQAENALREAQDRRAVGPT